MKNRIEDVDFIKGIVIFLMVCFHINVGILKNLTGWVYSFHMPIFLFYSGYFVSVSKPAFIRLKTIFRTLVVPFIFFECLYITMLFLAGKMGFNFSNNILKLDLNMLVYRIFVNPIGAYWYLHTLIIAFIIVLSVSTFKIKNDTSRIIIIIIIGLLCFGISLGIEGFKFDNALFFLVGYFFKIFSFEIFASMLSILGIIFIYYFGDTHRGSVSSLGTSFFMISFMKAIYQRVNSFLIADFITYLGKNTLIIVVLHPIFLNVFKLTERWFFKIDSTLIFYSLINTSFTILLSLFSAFLLDKIQLSKLLFGKNIYVKM